MQYPFIAMKTENSAKAAAIVLTSMGTMSWVVIASLVAAGLVMAAGAGMTAIGSGLIMSLPAMATGGVVSAPTITMVGEGRYPEAVVPLGDSPQLSSMKADIANAVLQGIMALQSANGRSGNSGGNEIVLNVDGTNLARVMIPQIENEQRRMGYALALREV